MSAKTIDELQREIDLAWEMIEDGWDIEPRAYFEAQAPKNGFRSALAQAVHHMWKRKVKDESEARKAPLVMLQKAPPAMPPYDDVVEALRARVKELERTVKDLEAENSNLQVGLEQANAE